MGNSLVHCCIDDDFPPQPRPAAPLPTPNPYPDSDPDLNPKKPIGWKDFEHIRYLCQSKHGHIVIVKRKGDQQTAQLSVMKIVKKTMIREENLLHSNVIQSGIVRENNPFLVKISHIFQNTQNIYIVMEYLQWRDVHYYLWMEGALEEELIKHIAAETVLGLQYLHSKGIIYRELKPENLLVTAEGHVKLSDYILSRMEKHNSPTRTYTGNVEYKAPEMLEEARGYTREADLWFLGILLYELKFGATPFKEDTEHEMNRKIKNGQIDFPEYIPISEDLKDLIKKLTQPDPKSRITLEEVMNHKFFAFLDWQQVMRRQNTTGLLEMVQKYDPAIRGPDDNPPARSYDSGLQRLCNFGVYQLTAETGCSLQSTQH